jgi:glycine cleavage system H protein
MEFPENLLYSEEHEWVEKIGPGKVRVGITDFAQNELGDIVYVELPEEGKEISAGDVLAVVESVKSAADVYSPVSGVVIEVNEELSARPELINEDPYGEGWIAVIELSDPSELERLMTAEEYKRMIGEE